MGTKRKGGRTMQCMKCGKDTVDNQVFCPSCLQTMEAYPVKPGAVVNLPSHKATAETKKPAHRKRAMTPDEQIAYLQKHLRYYRILGWILAILLLASSGILLYETISPDRPVIGQNYTIDTGMDLD